MLKTEFIRARTVNAGRLLIILHGLGDSIEGCRWIVPALDLPSFHTLLVNAPDPYFGGFAWYDFTGNVSAGVERSRRLLFELLDAQVAAGYTADNIVLGGFSQGSLMALEVGLRYPLRLGGIVGVSGYVADPANLVRSLSPVAREQRLLVTHGILDPLIPVAFAREQIRFLQAQGLQIQWQEFVKPHVFGGEEELGLIRKFISES